MTPHPLNRTNAFAYNGADQITNLITYVGGEQRIKHFQHTSTNGFSRLTRVITPMGKTTDYDYTFRGWLASRVDGLGRSNEFHYDSLGRLSTVTLSNEPLLSLQYDVLSKVTAINSQHSTFNYAYDSLNRATQAVCVLTNLPGFANVTYRLDYQYDAVGNLTNRVLTGISGLSDIITTRYAYDAMNRLTNVIQLTNGVQSATASYGWHGQGQMNLKTYGNGDTVKYDFDRESRPWRMGITNGTTPVRWYGYQWNPGNQILSITNDGVVTTYAYDAAGQLTNEVTGTFTNGWVYDEAGNWLNATPDSKWVYNTDNEITGRLPLSASNATNITVTGEVEPGPNSNKWYQSVARLRETTVTVSTNDGTFSIPNVAVYPGQNTLKVTVTDVSGNTATQTRNFIRTNSVLEHFSHDGNGNLTNWVSGSQSWSYEWDWADRLTKVSSNGVVLLQNWYDANSRRIAKAELVSGVTKKWLYLYDGWEIVGVMNEAGTIQETFTRGVGLAGDIGTLVAVTHHAGASVGTHYTHHNHRGDIVIVRTGTTTTATYEYSAFGTLTTQTGTDLSRFKFSSKEREASSGLSYYGYRFYAPQWQRWLNRDPIGEEGGANLTTFVSDAPTSFADSNGKFLSPVTGILTIGIAGLRAAICANQIKTEVWNEFGWDGAGNPQHGHRPGDDHFYYGHCVAHCRIQRECPGGRLTSWGGGLIKEIQDEIEQHFRKRGDGFDFGDMRANREGRWRGRHCKHQSCEEACKGTEG